VGKFPKQLEAAFNEVSQVVQEAAKKYRVVASIQRIEQ
jgi:translation initiation factor 2 subunit 1